MYYIDTSLLVAYYCPEALSEQVQNFICSQVKPSISSLTEVELFSAIAKKVRMDDLSRIDGHRILSKFLSHLDTDLYSIIPVETHHWRLARSWIGLLSTSLRTLDALHLSIASVGDFELVTSDQVLIRAAGALGVKVHELSGDSE